MEVRRAAAGDVEAIVAFDLVAKEQEGRRESIRNSVGAGVAWVAVVDSRVVGYTVLDYSFFQQGYIAMLYVHPDFRRRGVGSALVRRTETVCTTDKLFTSTNESNRPMQHLLARLEYSPSGVVNNLDEGDPEIIYFKRLR